jgi:hypothetical protein
MALLPPGCTSIGPGLVRAVNAVGFGLLYLRKYIPGKINRSIAAASFAQFNTRCLNFFSGDDEWLKMITNSIWLAIKPSKPNDYKSLTIYNPFTLTHKIGL